MEKIKTKEYDSPRIATFIMVMSECCLASSGNIEFGEDGDGIHVDEISW